MSVKPGAGFDLAATVRRADPDRFFCTLFAPAAARPALLLLYALNHELARATEIAREPALALIRLAWWREVVEGARRQHELAGPLADAIEAGMPDRDGLLALIAAREDALEPPADAARWLARLRAGPGELAVLAGRVLRASGPVLDRLRALGAGYGGAGQLRSAAASPLLLPPGDPVGLAAPLRDMLGRPAKLGAAVAAGLPAVLARRDLRHPGQLRPRGLADRAAVLRAAFRDQA